MNKLAKTLIIVAVAILVVLLIVLGVMYFMKTQNTAKVNDDLNIKGSLATMLTNGVVYFDTKGDFSGFCTDKYVTEPSAAIDKAYGGSGNVVCKVKQDNSGWCGCASLKAASDTPNGSTFCVDSRGYRQITQNAGGCQARCTTDGICVD